MVGYPSAEVPEQREVVVVGGGLAGLAAAYDLRDRDVVLLEAGARVGGRIRSEPRGDLWLNWGAHVFAGADSASGRLIRELRVPALPAPGRLAAVALRDEIVASGAVETYPLRLPLAVRDRVALVRAGLKLRLAVRRYAEVARAREGETPAERQARMLAFLDEPTFSQWIGALPPDVDAIFRATLNRSSGEPEELAAGYGIGYFHLVWDRDEGLTRLITGGSSLLPQGLAAALGDRVRLGTEATSVQEDADGVRVRYRDASGEHAIAARAAVVATPAFVTRAICAGLPRDTSHALAQIRYGQYVAAAILTGETGPMRWDRLYALATPGRAFNMLFNLGNAVHGHGGPRAEGGSLFVYAGGEAGRRQLELSDDEVGELYRRDLHDLFPETRRIVREVVIQRWPHGIPYPHAGRGRLQGALTRPLGRIHLAGDYLGSWYTETAAQTAAAAAAAARAQLGSA